jgi:hypothetical protein
MKKTDPEGKERSLLSAPFVRLILLRKKVYKHTFYQFMRVKKTFNCSSPQNDNFGYQWNIRSLIQNIRSFQLQALFVLNNKIEYYYEYKKKAC